MSFSTPGYLISSPPIDERYHFARKKAFPKANFVTMETLEQYVQIMAQVARVSKSHFLDLWSLMRSQPNYAKFLKPKDGVHFNQQGYEFFAPILSQKIQSITTNT